MNIKAFPSGPYATNAYIVACPLTKKAAIIDPAPDSFRAINIYVTANQLVVDKILITHSHWDHIAEVAALKKHFSVPIYIHQEDAPNLINPGADGLPFRMPIEGVAPDHYLTEKEPVEVGEIVFEVIHTPGHTPGGVCLYSKKDNVLFSGDTLFKGSIGNLSFPTSNPALMWHSLDKLAKLPPNTIVYPGHGPKTTIGNESWLPNAREIFGNMH